MRPKVVIPILIVLLVAIAILLWFRPNSPKANSDSATVPLIQSNASASGLKNDHSSVAVSSAPPSTTNQNHVVVDRNNPESIRQYLLSQNVPVGFFGKIIDQDGNPISGAQVKGEVLHVKVSFPAPGGAQDEIIPIDKKTDSNGRFEIQGMTGRSFDLETIQKDGYDLEPPRQRSYRATGGSLENPIIFKMWSNQIHEKLISGGKSFDIVPDGRAYFINLTDDTISESGRGDLKVWIQYTNQVVRGQLYDWSAGIEVVNGGLLEELLGSAMYEAATEGYVPSFQLQGKIKGGQRGDIGERQFYLKLKDGQEYGQMSIGLYAPFNDQTPGLIRLSYTINPSGSRILR